MNVVINLDKPKGISSQQAVTRVKRITGVRKAGHAGTLDPMATGVLLVCTGEATKVTRFLSGLDKEYITVMKLGEKTDTYDSEGKVIRKTEGFSFRNEDIEKAIKGFIGTGEQTPPMFSAVKIGGNTLYKLARKGIVVERAKRIVNIREIEITGFNLPLIEMRISCSKGTYIRSLCNDIGEALGVGAHITELRRVRTGDFSVEDSVNFNDLEKSIRNYELGIRNGNNMRETPIFSIDSALRHFSELLLTDKQFNMVKNGIPLRCPDHLSPSPDEYLKLKDISGSLFAIGKVSDRLIKMERMLHLTSYP